MLFMPVIEYNAKVNKLFSASDCHIKKTCSLIKTNLVLFRVEMHSLTKNYEMPGKGVIL